MEERIEEIKKQIARNKAYRGIKIPADMKCQICKINLVKIRHHPDYTKPLEVIFLCEECHKDEHERLKIKERKLRIYECLKCGSSIQSFKIPIYCACGNKSKFNLMEII